MGACVCTCICFCVSVTEIFPFVSFFSQDSLTENSFKFIFSSLRVAVVFFLCSVRHFICVVRFQQLLRSVVYTNSKSISKLCTPVIGVVRDSLPDTTICVCVCVSVCADLFFFSREILIGK